jgi:hypothetical protein
MSTHKDQTQEHKSQSFLDNKSQVQKNGGSTFNFVDTRSEAITQRKLQEIANNSPRVSQLKAFQDMADKSPQVNHIARLRATADNYSAQRQQQPIQKKENNTGLPDNLKTGMENLSGMSMDDVEVHHNSDKPAQLQAHAYAQGTDIHLAPGQEKHLPHEAWHVVQQKQGRVKPTMQMKVNVNVNDDSDLEREADVMGTKALQIQGDYTKTLQQKPIERGITQLKLQKTKVYGRTHLVKMVNGSLYSENFETNEGRQLDDGDIIEMETDSAINSRRGPNQEVDALNTLDKTGPQHYIWYLVKSVNQKGIDDSFYIRKDTFKKVKENVFDKSFDKTEALLDSIASGSGITGDFGDRNLLVAPNEYSGDHMNQEGGAKLNNGYFDVGEGVNVGLGAINIHGAIKKLKDGEKVEALAQGLEGVGQISHGGAKLAKGIALLKEGSSASGGFSADWTRVGDVGAAVGDGLATVSKLISIFKTIDDALIKNKEEGGLTGEEIVDVIAETGENVVGYFQSAMNTGKDILKAATDVGAGNPAIQAEIAQFAQISAVLGIITGSIQIIHGGVTLGRAHFKKGEIQETKEAVTKPLFELEREISNIKATIQRKMRHLEKAASYGTIPEGSRKIAEDNIRKITTKLAELQHAYVELDVFYNKNVPAMDEMKKIQSQSMEKAGLKMAQGSIAVVGSALLLSGVGAPIAVGVAAIGGILTLGNIGVQWRRGAAAERARTVASKLDNNGQPTQDVEPEYPDYQVMENRIFKNYCQNLKWTLENQNFPGLTKEESLEVKRFGWSDKKARIKSKDHFNIDSVNDVDSVSNLAKREKWIQVVNNGKVTHKEKPKGIVKVLAKITASPHKSKVSMEASATVIAEALYRLGMESYRNGEFIACKIIPVKIEEGVNMEQIKNQTSTMLLKTAGITGKRWEAWLETTKGDKAKMKENIIKQVSS